MFNNVRNRLDAFSLALGGVSAKSPYGGLQIVANDRINAAWDEKFRAESRHEHPGIDGECAGAGWAT